MAIIVDQGKNIFTLHTKNSTYQMKVDELGFLLHTYYGSRIDNTDMSYLIYNMDRGFSGNPYEIGGKDRSYSLDTLPQEYSCFGTGDYRISALRIKNGDGSRGVQLYYDKYILNKGKYSIPDLPAVYADDDESETLEIILKDPYSHVEVHLYYGVLEKNDIITRAVKVVNKGSEKIVVEKAASLSLDWISQDFDWITFYGRHNMERIPQRSAINHGIQAIGSVRGTSSHHYNPFAILCEKGADETKGQCFGISFVYSGEFLMEVEKDQVNQTRLVCGIHPDNFEWNLLPGEEFNSPEAIMTYSPHGFGQLSRNLHETIREHICRGEWKHKRRPVLVNNWEATYFNFTGDQLVEIAKDAANIMQKHLDIIYTLYYLFMGALRI